jgi:hypothetical protein
MMLKPYSLSVYDAERRWVGGWEGITVPTKDALKMAVEVSPTAKLYKRNRGDMLPIPGVS